MITRNQRKYRWDIFFRSIMNYFIESNEVEDDKQEIKTLTEIIIKSINEIISATKKISKILEKNKSINI